MAQHTQRAAIERYLGEVEPIRLAVNKFLGGAADAPLPAGRRDADPAPEYIGRRVLSARAT